MQGDVRVLYIVDFEFLYWCGCNDEEVQVDGAFTRNISNHNDRAHRLASNEVGEPGERGSDCS